MRKKKISVLITNYNKSRFLSKALKNVCNQEFKNYEIILYDDASTDNSIKIIKKFKKVKLIEGKKKFKKSASISQIHGILKAFKISKGEIICFMDGDDYFKSSKLKKIKNVFKKNKSFNSVFNLPVCNQSQFNLRLKKINNNIWPTIFPTSCISVKRDFFKKFMRYLKKNEFEYLEIDARLTIFSKFYFNEYNILKLKLTKYNFDYLGITSKMNIFSRKWWLRRNDAFKYLNYILKKKNQKFNKSFDFFITFALSFFLR